MCGRVAIYSPPKYIAKFLAAAFAAGLEFDGLPSWNIGPQRQLLGLSERGEGRLLDAYRWGLIPSWSKDRSIANKLFNARAETVAERPAFRSAFAKRPCVIPVDGFYEWDHRSATKKQPYYFSRTDDSLLLLAGLYEYWRDPTLPRDAPGVRTCTVITTTPSEDMDGIHDRMPVVLEPDEIDTWLDFQDVDPVHRGSLLDPALRGTLRHYRVGSDVGSVRNDGPELIEALDLTT